MTRKDVTQLVVQLLAYACLRRRHLATLHWAIRNRNHRPLVLRQLLQDLQ